MAGVVTYVIEAAVGVACLIAASSIRRRPGLRVWSALLGVAGVAAVVHAALSLV